MPSHQRRLRKLTRRIRRKVFTDPLMWLAKQLVPPLYVAYMRFVWCTSRIEDRGIGQAFEILHQHGGALALFWHEEVFAAPYCYHRLGFRGHTLINRSDVGEIITGIAERLDYVVFRGGSSSRRSRRSDHVIEDMIQEMKGESEILYGVAVDGSQGPPYRLKRGALVIARKCQKPILLSRIWFQRYVSLPTWDGMIVPLPFNRIYAYARGPYFVPTNPPLKVMEKIRVDLEDEMIELASASYEDTRKRRPLNLLKAPRPAAESVGGAT